MIDQEIIDLIKLDENKGFTLMYDEFYDSSCAVMYRKGLTSDEEQKDVFQISLMAFMVAVRKDNFVLTSKLSTLFFGIVIKQCYKVFNYHSKFDSSAYNNDDLNLFELIPDTSSIVDELTSVKVNKIVQDEISGSNKLQILNLMFLEGKNQQEIADELGYSGTDSIKSQKYKGIKMMRKKLSKKYREEDLKYYID